jgi:hypothetical protein
MNKFLVTFYLEGGFSVDTIVEKPSFEEAKKSFSGNGIIEVEDKYGSYYRFDSGDVKLKKVTAI